MIKYLINLVELRTKVASVFPLVYTMVIYIYYFNDYQFSYLVAFIFSISMICLDMATTVLNHISGMSVEAETSHYDKQLLKMMEELKVDSSFNTKVLVMFISIGLILGIILAFTTNLLVLIVGAICVAVAAIYSNGPIPLKNTCLGEIASGVTMGMLIPIAFICAQDTSVFIISFDYRSVTFNIVNIVKWGTILLIPTLSIANIMLANNICDFKKDKNDGRITLPHVINKQNSKWLWLINYLLCYILLIVLLIANILPLVSVIVLVSIPFVFTNIKKFIKKPLKSKTFKYAVFNLQIIVGSIIVTTILGMLIKSIDK